MKRLLSAFLIAGLFSFSGAATVQTTAAKTEAKKTAPAKAKTAKAAHKDKAAKPMVHATCNDGTKYEGKSRKGACSGHKGVKSWDKADKA